MEDQRTKLMDLLGRRRVPRAHLETMLALISGAEECSPFEEYTRAQADCKRITEHAQACREKKQQSRPQKRRREASAAPTSEPSAKPTTTHDGAASAPTSQAERACRPSTQVADEVPDFGSFTTWFLVTRRKYETTRLISLWCDECNKPPIDYVAAMVGSKICPHVYADAKRQHSTCGWPASPKLIFCSDCRTRPGDMHAPQCSARLGNVRFQWKTPS